VADEVAQGFSRVLENTSFILGKDVADFEAQFRALYGCEALRRGRQRNGRAGVGAARGGNRPRRRGDSPANTFIATPLAVARAGATPVLVDCDPIYQLIDPVQVEAKITPRTKALMPVHLFGQLAPMQPLMALAKKHGLKVFEDAAQVQGAKQDGKSAGSFGLAAGTSFYPGKNLGAYGDGGGVITDSDEIAKKVKALRNYGSEVKYHHPETGFNSRLDTLQAVVLSAKLKRLEGWNASRRAAAQRYDTLLAGVKNVACRRRCPATSTSGTST